VLDQTMHDKELAYLRERHADRLRELRCQFGSAKLSTGWHRTCCVTVAAGRRRAGISTRALPATPPWVRAALSAS